MRAIRSTTAASAAETSPNRLPPGVGPLLSAQTKRAVSKEAEQVDPFGLYATRRTFGLVTTHQSAETIRCRGQAAASKFAVELWS